MKSFLKKLGCVSKRSVRRVFENKFAISGHQAHLLEHSIVTPSLAAKIMYDKYINAVPINRISKELGWLDAVIRPATKSYMWVYHTADQYGSPQKKVC